MALMGVSRVATSPLVFSDRRCLGFVDIAHRKRESAVVRLAKT